jgi:hypothetical protein
MEELEEGTGGALRGAVRSAGDHPDLHGLLLVVGGSVKSKPIQLDLVQRRPN